MTCFRGQRSGLRFSTLFLFLLVAWRPAVAGDKDGILNTLSLKLSGGLGLTGIGDLRDHVGALDDYLHSFCNEYNYLPGQLDRPGIWGPDVALEVRLELGRGLSLGIGTGFMKTADHSASYGIGDFSGGAPVLDPRSITTDLRSDIRSIPVQADISRSWPLSRNLSLTAGAGVAVYFSSVKLERRMGIHPVFYVVEELVIRPHLDDLFSLSGFGIGPLGKVGLEYKISRPLTLVLEVEGRYAGITHLKGLQDYSYYSPLNAEYFVHGEIEGTLQIGTSDKTVMGLTNDFPDLSVTPSETMRTARLDLSGFSCRLGFRLRLF
jgi:hypothetical protein